MSFSLELKPLTFGGPPILIYVAHTMPDKCMHTKYNSYTLRSTAYRPCEDPMFWFNSKRTARKAAFLAERAIPLCLPQRDPSFTWRAYGVNRPGWRNTQHAITPSGMSNRKTDLQMN